MTIRIVYTSVDGGRSVRQSKVLRHAQRFAHDMVGDRPEIGSSYAAASNGAGRIEVEGTTLTELFPARSAIANLPPDLEKMNAVRAVWAGRALNTFRKVTGTDSQDLLADLLCDLRHWADRHPESLSFDLANQRARLAYIDETAAE